MSSAPSEAYGSVRLISIVSNMHHCGLWVANDLVSLAQAITEMRLRDLCQMGIHGRQWMEADYSWKDVADHMCALYTELDARQKSIHNKAFR